MIVLSAHRIDLLHLLPLPVSASVSYFQLAMMGSCDLCTHERSDLGRFRACSAMHFLPLRKTKSGEIRRRRYLIMFSDAASRVLDLLSLPCCLAQEAPASRMFSRRALIELEASRRAAAEAATI